MTLAFAHHVNWDFCRVWVWQKPLTVHCLSSQAQLLGSAVILIGQGGQTGKACLVSW